MLSLKNTPTNPGIGGGGPIEAQGSNGGAGMISDMHSLRAQFVFKISELQYHLLYNDFHSPHPCITRAT